VEHGFVSLSGEHQRRIPDPRFGKDESKHYEERQDGRNSCDEVDVLICCLANSTIEIRRLPTQIGSQEDEDQTGLVRVLVGHKDAVTCICDLGDGSLLSGSRDATLKRWILSDAGFDRTSSEITTFVGHTMPITGVKKLYPRSYCNSETTMVAASTSLDSDIRLWDLNTSGCIRVLKGHVSWVVGTVVQLPEGGPLVTGSWDRTIRVWDPITGDCASTFRVPGAMNYLTQLRNGSIVYYAYDVSNNTRSIEAIKITRLVRELRLPAR